MAAFFPLRKGRVSFEFGLRLPHEKHKEYQMGFR